jgi:hypothetical protein
MTHLGDWFRSFLPFLVARKAATPRRVVGRRFEKERPWC